MQGRKSERRRRIRPQWGLTVIILSSNNIEREKDRKRIEKRKRRGEMERAWKEEGS